MKSALEIVKGTTFSMAVFWEDRDNLLRFPISAVSLATGVPVLTVVDFDLPTGWRGFVSLAEGMRQINAKNNPPMSEDWHVLKVLSPTSVELSGVVPVDGGRKWPAYTGGGFLYVYAPVDMTGYEARMDVVDKVGPGGVVLISSEVAASPNDVINLAVEPLNNRVIITIDAVDTAALTFKRGVTGLELVSSTGVVSKLKLTGTPDTDPDPVTVFEEATT